MVLILYKYHVCIGHTIYTRIQSIYWISKFNYQKFHIITTICPRSLGSFYMARYYMKGTRLLGHTVRLLRS